jgi:hypothetical protein
MVRRKKQQPQWQLIVRGDQCEPLAADLVAQIVLMLGRQLAQETLADESPPSPDEGPGR